jgi:hypothetical protein
MKSAGTTTKKTHSKLLPIEDQQTCFVGKEQSRTTDFHKEFNIRRIGDILRTKYDPMFVEALYFELDEDVQGIQVNKN